jgi:hypothetical protein
LLGLAHSYSPCVLEFFLGIPLQLRNTPAGIEGSRKHNAMLRLATLRYAAVAQLRSPPLGFEEITKRHFSMCQKRLLVQARRWMLEEEGTPAYPRFERVYGELVRLLLPLDYDSGKRLLPLAEDAAVVQEHDISFPPIQMHESETSSDGESKPAAFAASSNNGAPPAASDARTTASANLERPETQNSDGSYNPWADPGSVANTPKQEESDRSDAGDDSDEDMYA